jgi:hypothetical protein
LSFETVLMCGVRKGNTWRICGTRLAVVGQSAKPTGRILARLSEIHTGCAGVRCPRCRMVTEYRIQDRGAA